MRKKEEEGINIVSVCMYTMSTNIMNKSIKIGFGNKSKKLLAIAVISMITVFILSQSYAIVPAGHRGVFLVWGAVDESRSVDEGLTFKAPFANEILPIEVRKRIFTDSTAAASKDLQDVTTSITVEYRIEKESVQKLWKEIGGDFERRIISPAIDEVTKQVTANYQAEELITKRQLVKQDIEDAIQDRLADNYLILSQVSITDFKFSDLFTQAIESKVEAEQKALKAENDLRRIEVEARQNEQQALGDAAANIARANGDAAANITRAEGIAEANFIKSQGEAKAILSINESLQDSPEYMEWLKTKTWDGKLPNVTGGAIPFVQIPMEGVQ